MNKKETILQVALQLFSSQGFDTTSTSLIAKKAEVSEGLIFRHFTNKEGLLHEILLEGFIKIKPFIDAVLVETEPSQIILKTLELPFLMISEQRDFWKLQINIRQQNDKFRKDFDENDFFEPLNKKILTAFKTLKVAKPDIETESFFISLTGLGLYFLDNGNKANAYKIIKNLHQKFTH